MTTETPKKETGKRTKPTFARPWICKREDGSEYAIVAVDVRVAKDSDTMALLSGKIPTLGTEKEPTA